MNILQTLQSGGATVTNTSIDIGNINNVFDGNDGTLARSAGVNPFVITLSFTNTISVTSVRVLQTYANGWFSLEAANTIADLNGQTGSYQLLLNMVAMTDNVPVVQSIATSRKVFRLTVRRTTGDNYVHLNEWNLVADVNYQADALISSPASINMHPGWEVWLNKPGTAQCPTLFSVQGGVNYPINQQCVAWSVSDPSILQLDAATMKLKALATGSADLIANIGSGLITIPVSVTRLTSPGEPDLSVRYIKRLPEINYVQNSANPAVEGWPAAGQTITWRAHIRNWSGNTYNGISYQWKKNGAVIASGTTNFLPDEEKSLQINDTWAFQRDSIELIIDNTNIVSETSEINNQLKIYTNAISLNLYVEQSLYDYFHVYQSQLGVGTNSWDDWAQMLHVRRWNLMFQNAVFPDAPNGVLDRIRVDSIVVVPDSSLPLAGGLPSNNPNTADRTVDLQWGFEYSSTMLSFYSNHTGTSDGNPFFFEGSLLHELGHARYLIDHYGMDLTTSQVHIKEGSVSIAGSALLPIIVFDVVYYNKHGGLMIGPYPSISPYEAMALNRIAYRRAICGNMNSPCNIGIFIQDLPSNNHITLRDQDDNLLTNACVEIYRAIPLGGVAYNKDFDDVPDLSLTTDVNGKINVGRNPFSATDATPIFGPGGMDIVLRVEKDNKVGYKIIEATDFNMEYWRGNTVNANYSYQFNMLSCSNFSGSACTCIMENTWTGAVSTAWENPANWSRGTVPDQDTYVNINQGLPRYPIVSSMASCKKVTLAPGVSIQVNTGFKLTVTGN